MLFLWVFEVIWVNIEWGKGLVSVFYVVLLAAVIGRFLLTFLYHIDLMVNCDLFLIHFLTLQQSPSTLSSGIAVSANYKYIEPASGCAGVCPVGDYASQGFASQVLEKEVSL